MANVKKGYEVVSNSSRRSSEVIKAVARELEEADFTIKIDDLIEARGISQRQLSELTGIQLSYLSDIILGKTTTLNKTHLLALMAVLRVSSIEDIIEIRLPDLQEAQFKREASEWIDTKELPDDVLRIAHIATEIRNTQ